MSDRLKQLEVVGRGSMAEVFRGVLVGERGTHRNVAIKRLHADLCNDPAAVELFVTEARLAVRLSHPNVVHALELTRDKDGYALVCEWLDCMPLAELCQRFGPLPWEAVLYVGQAICRALAYLHALDGAIVHRDVTPSNMLVTADGRVKLGDFGVAWCGTDTGPVEVTAAGTPGFAAPETTVDARTDVFGLGASLNALAEDLPAPLQAVIDRARQLDPEARFADAQGFETRLHVAADELQVRVSRSALRDWVSAHGGLPKRTPPPSLDGAVSSILGGALEPRATGPSEQVHVPRAPPRRQTTLVALLAIVTAGAIVYWGLDSTPASTLDVPTSAGGGESTLAGPGRSTSTDAGEPRSFGIADADPGRQPEPRPVPAPEHARQPQTKRSRATRHDAPAFVGTVSLNAVPWARVWVDGTPVGNTPIKGLELTAGHHTVRLVHAPQQLEREVQVVVSGRRAQTFLVNLRRGTVAKRLH